MTALALSADLIQDANAPPLFEVTGWSAPELAGVTVAGELDLATAPLLTAEVRSVCASTPDAGEFRLDLAAVTFLDSIGLRAADRAVQAATNWGWRVRVVQPTATEPRQLILLARRKGQSPR